MSQNVKKQALRKSHHFASNDFQFEEQAISNKAAGVNQVLKNFYRTASRKKKLVKSFSKNRSFVYQTKIEFFIYKN